MSTRMHAFHRIVRPLHFAVGGAVLTGLFLMVPGSTARADVAATIDHVDYGLGEVKSCTTGYQAGTRGAFGAWGAYIDGCTVRVRCMFKEGCTVGGRGLIQGEQFGGQRVTLNSRLRVHDASGMRTIERSDASCDRVDHCSAGNLDHGLTNQAVASVQCNGVHDPSAPRARVSCVVHIYRGYGAQNPKLLRGTTLRICPGADVPVDQLSPGEAQAAMLCLTNRHRRAADLPGLAFSRALTSAASGHASAASSQPWWDGRDPHRDPHTGTIPPDRIRAAGFCPVPKFVGLERPENTYTAWSSGSGASAPTPREAVTWWMEHHVRDGFPVEQNGHRMAILNPGATEMGNAAVARTAVPGVAADRGGTFVQTFGSCVA